jgi:hypothetical protein
MRDDSENTPLPASISAVIWRDVHAIREGQKDMSRQIERIGGRLVHVEHEIVAIHGEGGKNGKIGNLSRSVSEIRNDMQDALSSSRWMLGILVGVLMAALGGVFVVRDRLTAMEVNSTRNREDIKEIVRKVERWHEAPRP